MLELKNISYFAKNSKKEILSNINLTINEKFVVITGPNGSGKSSLAKLIMGINQATSGQIFIDGQDITNLSITERANLGIGFAFQQPIKFKGISVGDLISISSKQNLKLLDVCKYLSEVGLCAREYVNREINSTLSGGELKRIEIASLMAKDSKFSIFDEPEAGIDLWSFSKLIEVFETLNKKNNGTILIISHQEKILNIADRIIVMENGAVKYDGTKEEILPKLNAVAVCSAIKNGDENGIR